LSGHLVELPDRKNPAPRGMDALQVKLEPDPAHPVNDPAHPGAKRPDVLVTVKYQTFLQGRDTPIPRA
jgi:hypothetical protein